MKKIINILLLIVGLILLTPQIIPLSLGGIAWTLAKLSELLNKLFTYPLALIEYLVLKINK